MNRVFGRSGKVLADRFHHVLKRTPTEVRRALAYVLLNARKHYRQRRRRVPPVVLDGASSGLWFDGWKGRGPPPGALRGRGPGQPEVALPRTWLLSNGWRRIGLVDSRGGAGRLNRRVPEHIDRNTSATARPRNIGQRKRPGRAFGLTRPAEALRLSLTELSVFHARGRLLALPG